MCPGFGREGRLRCFAHPLGGVVCRGHAQYPAFAPDTLFLLQALQKWQLGFLVSLYLLDPEFAPTVHACSYFSPILFLCILLLKERCVQVQALQHCSKGSQVPVCLTSSQSRGQALKSLLTSQ